MAIAVHDIIDIPQGIHRKIERVVILNVHTYDTGDLSIRFRYASNRHRGVDWRGFLDKADADAAVHVGRDETVDLASRSMLP